MLIKMRWLSGYNDRYIMVDPDAVVLLLERPTQGISIDGEEIVPTRPPVTGICLRGNHTVEVPFDLATTHSILRGYADENGKHLGYDGSGVDSC